MYRTDKIGKRVDSCPTPISALKNRDVKWFHTYWVFLLIK